MREKSSDVFQLSWNTSSRRRAECGSPGSTHCFIGRGRTGAKSRLAAKSAVPTFLRIATGAKPGRKSKNATLWRGGPRPVKKKTHLTKQNSNFTVPHLHHT